MTGSLRNIYFPFDTVTDTAIDVATEMVKELEISDWEPFEIAEMIQGEISALIPHHDTFNYQDDDDENDGTHHPLYSFSSSSSSQASMSGLITSHGVDNIANPCDWLQGMTPILFLFFLTFYKLNYLFIYSGSHFTT